MRGNGKIVQELEGVFRGAGWNVIKVLWGSDWDQLLAKDKSGMLRKRMEECVDGEYQDFKSKNGAYVREHFFGKYPETAELVKDWSDEDIWALRRGGHDPLKVYAAYAAAVKHTGQPTVILAKTVKGYGMGEAGEGQMITHQQKKMGIEALRKFRDRFAIPITDDKVEEVSFLTFADGSPEKKYLRGTATQARRTAAAAPTQIRFARGAAAERVRRTAREHRGSRDIDDHGLRAHPQHDAARQGARPVRRSDRAGRVAHLRHGGAVPTARIFSQVGQLYKPQDADQLMYYREDKSGQMLQEGINEAGAMSSWIAAATSYSTSNVPMIPFYIFYSMFGLQRVGDLAWAAGDMRCRGFLLGGTAGRTTLNGEGLQHEDGHSHVLASTIPNCVVVRSDLRLRGRRHHPGRLATHVQGPGGRLLLRHR